MALAVLAFRPAPRPRSAGPRGGSHPLRAGAPGHRRTARSDAVLDKPVPLCLVSQFRDVLPGVRRPDGPAPGAGTRGHAVIDNLKRESVTVDTDYDRIAEKYQQWKLQPWPTHLERYTLLRLAG